MARLTEDEMQQFLNLFARYVGQEVEEGNPVSADQPDWYHKAIDTMNPKQIQALSSDSFASGLAEAIGHEVAITALADSDTGSTKFSFTLTVHDQRKLLKYGVEQE